MTVLSATTVLLSWQPPPPSSRNGLIINYVIRYSRVGQPTSSIANTSSTQEIITGLHPYANYLFSIAATTSAGVGPFSDSVIVETFESGKHVCVHLWVGV